MSRASREWTLPGPNLFISDVASTARKHGIAAIVAPPHCPPRVDAALEDALPQYGVSAINARDGISPLAALSQAFGLTITSAAAVPLDRTVDGQVAIVQELESGDWSRWEPTVRAWTASCARRSSFGPILILIVPPSCEEAINAIGIKAHLWKGVISSRDCMRWALDFVPARIDPLIARLAIETAVALAGWDLEDVAGLVQDFIEAPRSMFGLAEACNRGSLPTSWAAGSADVLDGVAYCKRNCCSREDIIRRIWTAQMGVLFGWLETERTSYVERHRQTIQRINAGSHQPFHDVDALEWADIARLMRSQFPSADGRVQYAEHARIARNALAHLEPMDYAHFERIRMLARQDRVRNN